MDYGYTWFYIRENPNKPFGKPITFWWMVGYP